MVFPTIPTSAAGRVLSSANTSPAGTHTFPNLSSLTKNSGDLLIAIIVTYDGNSTNAEFSSWGASFTEFVDQATTTTMGIGAAYKWSTGSETGTFTVASADTSTNDSQCILLSIPGAHASTPPEGGTIANGTTTAANPLSLDPAGWAAEDTLWIAIAGNGEDTTTGSFTVVTAAPTNYTNLFATTFSADVVGGVGAGVAFRQLNAASEDVGAFTVDVSNARNSGLLIAVRPAPAKNTAATQVATSTSNYNSTSPKSTGSLSWQSGDDVYVIGQTGSNNTTLSTPTVTNLTGTGLTFAAVGTNPVGGANNSLVYKWKATATGSGSGNIQSTDTGTDDWGIRAWQFRGSDGTGNVATLVDTTHVVSLTRANDHSLVIAGLADFSATAVGSSSVSPATGGTLRDSVLTGGTGTFTAFTADWTDQSTAGATSYGVANNTSTGAWTKVAIEILGTVSSGVTGDVTATVTAGSTVTAVVDRPGAVDATTTAGSTVTGIVDRQGTVTAITTAGSTVTGSVGGGALTGDVAATITAGSTATATVAATGAVSASITAGSTVTAVVGLLGAISATETSGSTVSGLVGVVGAVTATTTSGSTVTAVVNRSAAITTTITAGSTVTGSTVSGVIGTVTSITTAGSTVTALVGRVGTVTTTTTASVTTAAVVARTATVTHTTTAGSTIITAASVTATITAGSIVTASIQGAIVYGTSRLGTADTTRALVGVGTGPTGLIGSADTTHGSPGGDI